MIDTTDSRYNNTELVYERTSVRGWSVKYQPGVWQHHPALGALLEADLAQIETLLPAHILKTMKEVVIYINISYRYPAHHLNILGACCHQSADWLTQNGNLAEKESHIEIYDAQSYLDWVAVQPSMILHELCHGLHWRLKEKVDTVITEAYNIAKKSGKYEQVHHFNGSLGPHYCLTNHQEYFSECSEAFWSSERFRNDFYPFVYPELKLFDPTGFEMVRSVFNVEEREGTLNSFTPPDYNPEEYLLPKLTRTNQSGRFFFKFAVLSPIGTYFALNCVPNGQFANIITASIFALHIVRYL